MNPELRKPPVRGDSLFRVIVLSLLFVPLISMAAPHQLSPKQITANVYALIGDTGGRSFENHGLNNNMGFVVTDAGVILIDSGATPGGAAIIDRAIARITDKPVLWVVNTGSQDHRWLGNSFFAEKGAEIIALRRTVDTQKRVAGDLVENLKKILGDRAAGLRPVHAGSPIDGERASLEMGGKAFELIWPGDAHFPGDAILWLPEERVVFTGDLVYMDRMLGILPDSRVVDWQGAFSVMASLEPLHVVPGHGDAADLDKARRETGDYLAWLIKEVGARIDDWKELDETVDELSEAETFKHLRHFESWHRTNVNRTYLQLEASR